jgi:hypothetical protein
MTSLSNRSAEAFMRQAYRAPERLVGWRRKSNLLELLRVASAIRFQDPERATNPGEWYTKWQDVTSTIVRWSYRYANSQIRREANYAELADIVHAALEWRLIKGAVEATRKELFTVRQNGQNFSLTMTREPDLEVLDILLENDANPLVDPPLIPNEVYTWFRAAKAKNSGMVEPEAKVWKPLLRHSRQMIKWRRRWMPEGLLDDELPLTSQLSLGRALDLYAILIALGLFANLTVQYLNYSEATLLSFSRERCITTLMAGDKSVTREEAEWFTDLMTYKPAKKADASATPLIPYQDVLVLSTALINVRGAERTLLRAAAIDPANFGALGQRLGRLADRFASVLNSLHQARIATRVKAVRPDGTQAGDVDVLVVDFAAGQALAIEVKWPVEALTFGEADKINDDIRVGARQLDRLRSTLLAGGASLKTPPSWPAMHNLQWTWLVATPTQLGESGIPDIQPTSLRHLNSLVPVKDINALKAKLAVRPQRGRDYAIVRRSAKIFGMNVELDSINMLRNHWKL